jgi:5-oxoprolinase (ATP-hydrolysing)
VLIDNFKLVDRAASARSRTASSCSPITPTRPQRPHQNVADLKAQIAANEKGVQELRKMVAHFGSTWSRPIWATFRTMPRKACAGCSSPVGLRVRVPDRHRPGDQGEDHGRPRQARGDRRFHRHLAMQQPNNFNAPEPVARAAVLYVLPRDGRKPIPMNAGCLKPINIIIPEGSHAAPAYPRAVVAGNVETSQHVTNAMFCARRAGQQPGHDEQPHLRQRHLPVL